jgi:hypothetical protein
MWERDKAPSPSPSPIEKWERGQKEGKNESLRIAQ